MRFTHGSSMSIDESDFDVFDYIIDKNGKPNLDCIDNGNDGEGIGVYAFIGEDEKAKENASCYTSDKGAYVYVLDIDIEQEDLLNYRAPDEISIEQLVEVVEVFMNDLRNQKGANKIEFDRVIDSCEENFENMTVSEINEILKESGLNIELDEWAEPSEFDDFYDWKEQTEEQYSNNDPCDSIMREGGPEGVVEYSISKADNLWETIKYIGQSIAIQFTNHGTERYNKTFQKAVTETLRDERIVAAYVNDDNFAVIFDTDEIELVEKIDLNLKPEVPEKKNKRKVRI